VEIVQRDREGSIIGSESAGIKSGKRGRRHRLPAQPDKGSRQDRRSAARHTDIERAQNGEGAEGGHSE